MQLLSLSPPFKKQTVPSGTSLLNQQTREKCLYVLHSGKVAIHTPSLPFFSGKSLVLSRFENPSYFNYLSFLTPEESLPSYSTETESSISAYPYSNIYRLFEVNPKVFIALVRTMERDLKSYINFNNDLVNFLNLVCENVYRANLLLKKCGATPLALPDRYHSLKAKLEPSREEERELLESVSAFFSSSSAPGSHYKLFHSRSAKGLNGVFTKKVEKELTALLLAAPTLIRTIFDELLEEFLYLMRFIYNNLKSLSEELGYLVGAGRQEGVIQRLGLQGRQTPYFKANLSFFSGVFLYFLEKILSHHYVKAFFSAEQFVHWERALIIKPVEIMEGRLEEKAKLYKEKMQQQKNSLPVEEYDGGSSSFYEGSALPQAQAEEAALVLEPVLANFLGLGEAKIVGAAVPTAEEKLRKAANTFFIESYTKAAFNNYLALGGDGTSLPALRLPQMKTFFQVGILCKTILPAASYSLLIEEKKKFSAAPQQLEAADRSPSVQVFFLDEWLSRIAAGKLPPSLNEFGNTYEQHSQFIRRGLSEKEKKRASSKTLEEKTLSVIRYEMNNFITQAFRLVSESPRSALFPFSQRTLPSKLAGQIITKEKLLRTLEEIKQIDFSLFYRETLLNLSETRNDIIQEEVLPHFVFLPTVGSRVLFWQELEGASKTSPGRFALPWVFIGDLRRSLIEALALFRWELCRSSRGVGWKDGVTGGLCGAYHDYLSFYKKNSELTLEAKEALTRFLRQHQRDFRKMFVADYVKWIEFEARGVPQLSAVARKLFLLHAPFSKSLRQRLRKMPLYARPVEVYENLMLKQREKLKLRYRPFLKPGQPQARIERLERYLKFLAQ